MAYALIGLPVGLLSGLLLGVVANRERGTHDAGGWRSYASFRRRAVRLGHVAAIMLPLLGGFYALALGTWGADSSVLPWAAGLWIVGGALLVSVLIVTAWFPLVRYVLPLPALALTTAAVLFALAWVPALV
jgi:hypothetical protein